MFNILSLKDFKLNKMRIALPKDEEKSQYGNLIILNTKDLQGNQKIITNPFINKLSVYNQIYRDIKFTFKVRGKSINKRELKERFADYKIYKETNDLKGIVVFNSNQGKNMYYDISRFNQLFFEATVRENHTMKYIDYINILKEHILNQEFFKYYTNKIMIIDVENWMVAKVDTNKEESFDNPLNLIYYAMKKDFEAFQSIGDIEFIITSSNAMFRFNPIRCNEKSFNEFRRELNKIGKNLINEEDVTPDDAVVDKSLKILDQGSKKDTEITTTGQSLVNNPNVVNAVIKASDKASGSEGTEQNKIDSVVSDPKVVDAVKQQIMEPVNIKTDAMSKRDMELREAQKQVKIAGSNETIYDLMQRKASKIDIPVTDVSNKVKTLNKNMTTIKFPNFASAYNEHLYHKDITSIAYSMQDKSIPVYIRSIDREDTSDSLNLKETWTYNLEDENRRRHTLKFDIPIFIDDRYVFLNGNKKEFNNQRFLKPLVKTGPDTVQVCTNYNKIFMTRYGENVESKFEKFKQMVLTDKKRFGYKKGNCSRVNAEYKTTIEYDTLAKMFTEITCKNKSGKVELTLVFNQNKLKDYCLNNPALKGSYEYYTKNDALVVGYTADRCLAIDPDTQLIIDDVIKTKSIKESSVPVTEGVNLWVVGRVKEIDAEIEALRDGDNAERIDALTTEKDRILSMDSDNNAADIDKYLRNDDISSMEKEPVNESITATFYHGSDNKLSEITPTSPNMGNMFEDPKWVCYLWRDSENAVKFAVQKSVRNFIRTLKVKGVKFTSPCYDVTNGMSMLLSNEYDDIKGIVTKKKLVAYVHKVSAPLSYVGIGHASSINEYTSTKKLRVSNVDKIVIDDKVFDDCFEAGTVDDINRLKHTAMNSKDRGLLAYFMHDQLDIFKKEMKIKHMMSLGEINVGDDLSSILASESFITVTESSEEPLDDNSPDDMGIVNYILANHSEGLDIKEFAQYKSGKRFMYTRCKVMKKNIPLIVFLAYCEGLSTVLRKAGIRYMFSDKRPRMEGYDLVNKGAIQFADGYLIYDKYPLEKSLLMNGMSVVDTKNIEYADLDTKNAYLDIFDKLFGSRMLSNALDNFYEWMIDAPTAEILDDLNYPTEFVGLLLAGNKLLADNNYRDEIDMSNWRIRNNELVYAYAYKRIADAYTKYRMTSENKNPVKISIPKDAILKDIMMSQIVEDVSELSPIVDVEKSHTVTDKGPSGTNLEQAYTQERRCFHPSMTGVMAISTSPDANVGLVRELTLEPNIINARGYVAQKNDKELNDVNLFSAAELATPLGVTRDDTIRTAMASKQSGFRSIYG